jgi:hypothetical protein
MQRLDQAEAARYRRELLASDQEFSTAWLAGPAKVVVPMEEVADFADDADGARILQAFRDLGQTELVAFTSSPLDGGEHDAVRVPATAEALDAWHRQVTPFDFVVAAPDLSAAALLSVDEFALVAGPREFVESAAGAPLPQARAAFAEYAEDMKDASRHLPSLAVKYGCG